MDVLYFEQSARIDDTRATARRFEDINIPLWNHVKYSYDGAKNTGNINKQTIRQYLSVAIACCHALEADKLSQIV